MPKTLLIFLCFVLCFPLVSFCKGVNVYNELGATTDGKALRFGFTGSLGKNAISLCANFHFYEAENMPADYHPGFTIFGPRSVPEYITVGNIMYGRVIPARGTQLVRMLARAGFSVGKHTYPTNFKPVEPDKPSGFFTLSFGGGPNYTYDVVTKPVFGIIVNPLVEFPLTLAWGFSAGPYLNINNRQSLYGFEINMLVGKVRDRLIKKQVQ